MRQYGRMSYQREHACFSNTVAILTLLIGVHITGRVQNSVKVLLSFTMQLMKKQEISMYLSASFVCLYCNILRTAGLKLL